MDLDDTVAESVDFCLAPQDTQTLEDLFEVLGDETPVVPRIESQLAIKAPGVFEIARVELFLSLAPQIRDGWIGRPSENSAPAHENSEQNASAWRHGVFSQFSFVGCFLDGGKSATVPEEYQAEAWSALK